RNLQCRICWTGHVANGVLALLFAAQAFQLTSTLYAQAADPDALYKDRETIAKAQQAEQIWADRLAKDPKDFVSAWKLAKARYWLRGPPGGKTAKAALGRGTAPRR